MSRYSDACDDGYDGPSPFEEKRMASRRRQNDALDCRDPEHDGCQLCDDCFEDEEE